MIVACVLWKGNFRTRTYDESWVYNLKQMVEKTLDIPFDFVCFTNSNIRMDNIQTIKIDNNLRGWWYKMNIFNPIYLSKGETVLYLDLDLLILSSLISFVNYFKESDYLMLAPDMGAVKTKQTVCRYNSSVIMFKTGVQAINDLFIKFITKHEYWEERFRGDQDFIGHHVGMLSTFPKKWFTKIRTIKNCSYENIKKDTKIILMNPLKNDKASIKHKWIKECWEGA